MKIGYIFNEKTQLLQFTFELNLLNGDRKEYLNHNNKLIRLVKQKCCFVLPSDFKKKHLHNDLIALSSLLIIYPFIGLEIDFDFNISNQLYKTLLESGKNIKYKKTKDFFKSITKRDTSKQALCYSGGVDSTAASILLPKTTVHVFLDRINPISKKNTIYHKDQIYFSLDCLLKTGVNVISVKTDLEWMREPVGFIFDLACGVPSIILSQYYNYKNINYGYVKHHLHQITEEFQEYYCLGQWKLYIKPSSTTMKISDYYFWNNLYKAVDLNLNFPVIELTEFDTWYIVEKSRFNNFIHSCMRGYVGKPCGKCKKCCKLMFLQYAKLNDRLKSMEDLKKLVNLIKWILKRYNYELKNIMDYGNFELMGAWLAVKYHNVIPELSNTYKKIKNYEKDILKLTRKQYKT